MDVDELDRGAARPHADYPELTPLLRAPFVMKLGEGAAAGPLRRIEALLGARAPVVSVEATVADSVAALEEAVRLLLWVEERPHPAADVVLVQPLLESTVQLGRAFREDLGLEVPGRDSALAGAIPGVRASVVAAVSDDERETLGGLIAEGEGPAEREVSFFDAAVVLAQEFRWLSEAFEGLRGAPKTVAHVLGSAAVGILVVRTEQAMERAVWRRFADARRKRSSSG